MDKTILIEKLKQYGVGHRGFDDPLFANDKPPPLLGVCDIDDESLCHEVIKTTCHIPGCIFTAETLLEYETHYNTLHRYSCSQCKKQLPSPHFLDLHIQENHDTYFSVLANKKPSYCCYIEECKEKFLNPEERMDHCVKIHKLPKDFMFDQKPKSAKKKNNKNKKSKDNSMDVDSASTSASFSFNNSKKKSFSRYTGRKFTKDEKSETVDVNMDEVVNDLKESLPN